MRSGISPGSGGALGNPATQPASRSEQAEYARRTIGRVLPVKWISRWFRRRSRVQARCGSGAHKREAHEGLLPPHDNDAHRVGLRARNLVAGRRLPHAHVVDARRDADLRQASTTSGHAGARCGISVCYDLDPDSRNWRSPGRSHLDHERGPIRPGRGCAPSAREDDGEKEQREAMPPHHLDTLGVVQHDPVQVGLYTVCILPMLSNVDTPLPGNGAWIVRPTPELSRVGVPRFAAPGRIP